MRYALRVSLRAIVAALVLFHAGLLWQRLTDQSLLEPVIGLRWAVSVAVLLVGYRLCRAGLSLLGGRPAIGLWIAILLLHAGGAPAAAVLPVPGHGGALALVGMAGVALALASWLAAGTRPRPTLRSTGRLAIVPRGSAARWVLGTAQLSRPPPA